MIYGSQDSAVTFLGIQGSSNGDREVGVGEVGGSGEGKSSNSRAPLNQSGGG